MYKRQLIEDALSGGVGQGGELDVVELKGVLSGIVIGGIVSDVLEEGLEMLLGKGNALARDHAVLDGVGLLGNFDGTGVGDILAIKANDIQGHLAGGLGERGSGDGDGIIIVEEHPAGAGLGIAVPIAVIVGEARLLGVKVRLLLEPLTEPRR